ncbi:MAG: hypothetical protein AAGH92_00025 [Planctomycetota bacterium]
MHSSRLADPLDETTKAMAKITSKRSKTMADHEKLAELEWRGSLYLDADERVVIPSEVLEAVIVAGAKKMKKGPAAKAGVFVLDHARLDYEGPDSVAELWREERFRLRAAVAVNGRRVMRTRPKFEGWVADIHVQYVPELVGLDTIEEFLIAAGVQVGVGDWRPRYGRFTVKTMASDAA